MRILRGYVYFLNARVFEKSWKFFCTAKQMNNSGAVGMGSMGSAEPKYAGPSKENISKHAGPHLWALPKKDGQSRNFMVIQ